MKYTLKINVDTIVDGYAYLQKQAGGEWVKLDSSAQGKVRRINALIKFLSSEF